MTRPDAPPRVWWSGDLLFVERDPLGYDVIQWAPHVYAGGIEDSLPDDAIELHADIAASESLSLHAIARALDLPTDTPGARLALAVQDVVEELGRLRSPAGVDTTTRQSACQCCEQAEEVCAGIAGCCEPCAEIGRRTMHAPRPEVARTNPPESDRTTSKETR